MTLWQCLDNYMAAGLRHLLCTDISRDGALTGPNLKLYTQLIDRYPGILLQASGGVRSIEDLRALNNIGTHAAISGRALLDGKNYYRGDSVIPARRIIPCLDVRDGKVVKGVRFRDHRVVGDILDLAEKYCRDGADELVFYDITASPDGRTVSKSWVSDVAARLDIPFCVAGGIRSVADAEAILHNGADKISINSPALENPKLISSLANRFGSQCVVLGIDSQRVGTSWQVYQYTGDASRISATSRSTLDWVAEAQDLGAGEIVLNCMNQDGVRNGYDIEQLATVRKNAGCRW